MQDAFLVALERWPRDGLPDNPAAWIVTAARNRALDRIRSEQRWAGRRVALEAELRTIGDGEPDEQAPVSPIVDDRLRLVFTVCHPALAPEAREKLRRGIIEIGNTSDMVYVALGAPDDEYETTSARGKEKTWIYNSYHEDYAGNVQTGYHRMLVYDPATKGYFVYFEPVYNDVYTERIEERIRITFQDGKVTVIEQPKPY